VPGKKESQRRESRIRLVTEKVEASFYYKCLFFLLITIDQKDRFWWRFGDFCDYQHQRTLIERK